MFDIGWSELLVLGVIALIVVGPKELPALLRTIGRYAGMVKRQASDFRSQFDQVLREAEFDEIKKDFTGFKTQFEGAAREALRSAQNQTASVEKAITSSPDPVSTEPASPQPAAPASTSSPTPPAESNAPTVPAVDSASGAAKP